MPKVAGLAGIFTVAALHTGGHGLKHTVTDVSTQDDELRKPFHERNNPYAAFLEKRELVQATITKLEQEQTLSPPSTVVKLKLPSVPLTPEDGSVDQATRAANSVPASRPPPAATPAMPKRGPGRPPKTQQRSQLGA